ncbi:MAG: gliding motility-associated C-terminal domain-containing protein [Bacteroidetes bacterium]|nr:gliding motility-associated C-terminal domain-containing protein [Bacteroidota bacterium]
MKIQKYISILFFSLIGTLAIAQPANDDCSTATPIGTLPAAPACPGAGTGAQVNVAGTLVGATPANPYLYQPGCSGAGGPNMGVPANDVWYTFVASGFQAVITINSTFANPNVAMWSGTCGAFGTGVGGCAVGTGGTVTLTVEQMVIGQTYYIQVSGNTGQSGTFNMTIQNNRDCQDCLNGSTLTATPLPVNGMYQPGQTVNFCYHVSQYSQVNTNWLHGVQLAFGSGWNLASLTTTPSPTCQATGGYWAYYPAGITDAQGTAWPAGFYFETVAGQNNPGNNFGDNCSGSIAAGSWNFCFSITVAAACNPGANLNVSVNTSGDGESGSWTSTGCLDDPSTVLTAVGSCCPPTMASTPATCAGNDGTATATPVGGGPFTYSWAPGGQTTQTATGLAAGTYTVTVNYTNILCAVTNTVTVTGAALLATPTAGSNAPICSGTTLNLTAATVAGATGYSWTGPNGFTSNVQNPSITNVPLAASGTYTVVATAGGCTSSSTVNVTINNCACLITNYTANIGACNPATNQYSTTGTVTFVNRPATGNLVIVDCDGVQQTYPVASVTSPFNYTLNGQVADGQPCSIQAFFSADPTCSAILNYTAPFCPCNIDNFTANISACLGNNTYTVNGTIQYTSPPSTGVLTISVNNGTTSYDTIINPPFTSPDNWSISNIPADGSNITITATFSANPACTSTITSTAPAACACAADIGTFTINMTGNSNVNYVLCFGDQITVTANGDYTPPEIANNPPGPTYDPGIAWLVYSCPPTVAVNPDPVNTVPSDPCFLGIIDFNNFTDANDLSLLNSFPPGTFTNSTIYFVPLTMYSVVDGVYSYVNTTMPCYDMGTPIAVTYLTNITHTETQDCNAGTVTTTINGGLPALNGSQFTAVPGSLSPATASFANTTANNGGTITIQGLVNGPFSFQVEDANGCPTTVSGTFTGAENPAFSYPGNEFCNDAASINATVTGTPGGTFTATPAGLSINATTGAINIQASTPATYTITYTTPGTVCPRDSSFVLTIHPMPTLAIAGIDVTCFGANNGQTIVIPNGGTAPYNYSWTGGCTSASCSNLAPGSYTVTVTDAEGCIATADTSITQPTQLLASITGTTPTTCNGACDGTATANATGGTAAYTYSWNTIPVQNTATATGLCAGTYTCTITDANSCTSTTTATITQPTPVVINPTTNATICTGGNTTLTTSATGGDGNYTFTWSPATGLSATTGTSVTANPATTTVYTINAVDGNGCPATAVTVTVTVTPPLAVVTAGTASVCPGSGTPISATASAGNGGPYTYSWSPTTGLSNPTAQNPTASPTVTTTYTVTANDGCSPSVTATVTVTVLPVPVVNLAADITSGCAPLCVNFTDLSTVANGGNVTQWNWNFGGDGTSTTQNPSHCFVTPGQYSISLTVTSNGGCTNDTTITNMIDVFANPTAAFSWNPDPASVLDTIVSFYDQSSSDVTTWNWTFGDGGVSGVQNPVHPYAAIEGSYLATLVVTNANGCVDSVSNTIIVLPEFTFFIPNAFTPNGDGINDDFNGKGIGIVEYEMMIFDRWGNMIFFTDSIYKNWDGRANHGAEVAQQDVYVWKVRLKDVFDKKHQYIGTVTIVK